MNLIKKATLKKCWDKYPDAEKPLLAWYQIVIHAQWEKPNDLKLAFPNADIILNNRVVFNIGGNKFRLIANVEYRIKTIFIIWVGNHSEYDKIDAKTIRYKE